jgi:hypothetical protein
MEAGNGVVWANRATGEKEIGLDGAHVTELISATMAANAEKNTLATHFERLTMRSRLINDKLNQLAAHVQKP